MNNDEMIINRNLLPLTLQNALKSGEWARLGKTFVEMWRDEEKILTFKRVFIHAATKPYPQLFSIEGIKSVNQIWDEIDIASSFRGTKLENYFPGEIDFDKTVIIGETEPESPIALDYRYPNPRIIYFCDIGVQSLWVEATESVDRLIEIFKQ